MSSNAPNAPSAPNSLDKLTRTDVTPKIEISTKEPEPLQRGTKLVGQSGMQYQIDRMLQHRTDPILACVYLAVYVRFEIQQLILLICRGQQC